MIRLVFLVEGDTEVKFVNSLVIPYLYGKGFNIAMNVQKIVTNRKLHQKGGNVNYHYYRNDISRILSQGNVLVTSFVDFFRLPTNFPGFTTDSRRISEIEDAVSEDFKDSPYFIPYIQRHEIEALMFSGMDGLSFVVDDEDALEELNQIVTSYDNPEEINSSPENAPSKRLDRIFNYDKVSDGEMILEILGIDAIIARCPRFREWLIKIEARVLELTAKKK